MTNGAFDEFFGGPPRKPETWMSEREFDIAASRPEGLRGDRAAHGALPPQGDGPHEPVHGRRRRAQLRGQRPHHPRDAVRRTCGCSPRRATRAARWASPTTSTTPCTSSRAAPAWTHAYLGPAFTDAEIAQYLDGRGRQYTTLSDAGARRAHRAAHLGEATSSAGSRGGWSSGRARSAARSILADPRDPKMRDTLNLKIKFREGFRPFAPVGARGQGGGVVRARLREPVHAARRPRCARASAPSPR